jgi:hypothetical protein
MNNRRKTMPALWAWTTIAAAMGLGWLTAGDAGLTAIAAEPAAAPAAGAKAERGTWVDVSAAALAKLEEQKVKIAWPGKTTGVAVDRTTGDVYMLVCGQGVWKSTDKGATFQQVDGEAVGGRCETGYALCLDPAGKRLVCFMLDGKSAMTPDAGKAWSPVKNIARGYDWGAVDWSATPAKDIFALVHESGGVAAVSADAGKTWNQVGKDYLAVGLFAADALVCGKERQAGIQRSTDGGQTWQKVSDATPIGTMRVFKGAGYWLADKGLMISSDQGKTWKVHCEVAGAAWGPYFGKDESHFVVVNKEGFRETTDAGKAWKLIAPYPPGLRGEYNARGWFMNFAWDPVGKACYASKMGLPTWKCEY